MTSTIQGSFGCTYVYYKSGEIGRGAYGKVYKCYRREKDGEVSEEKEGREYALKVFKIKKGADAGVVDEGQENFEKEVCK